MGGTVAVGCAVVMGGTVAVGRAVAVPWAAGLSLQQAKAQLGEGVG